jgi:hypothetical protein
MVATDETDVQQIGIVCQLPTSSHDDPDGQFFIDDVSIYSIKSSRSTRWYAPGHDPLARL